MFQVRKQPGVLGPGLLGMRVLRSLNYGMHDHEYTTPPPPPTFERSVQQHCDKVLHT